MAGMLRVSVADMERAEARCRALSQEIERCRREAIAMNADLQAVYEGQAARSFDAFVQQTASPVLTQVSQMCDETARGIRNTLTEFMAADRSLAGVFRA